MQGGALEEVGGGKLIGDDAVAVGHRAEQLGLAALRRGDLQDGGHVAAAVAVVGRRPHSHQPLPKHVLVAFVHQLVRSADQVQVVDLQELLGHLLPKQVAGSSGAHHPEQRNTR